MRKILGFLFVSLLLGFGAAFEFPDDGEVVVTAESRVVGVGEFDHGDLELRLLAGFSGDATFTVVDGQGNEDSFTLTIGSDGAVSLDSEALQELVEESGGEAEITFDESIQANDNMAFGEGVPDHVMLPDVAVEGMAQAEANHELAQERAKANANVEMGEDVGAEASVNVGLGLGKQ